MEITEAKFVKSSPNHRLCPEAKLPEFAFIGRSNVGKSSLINMLTGRKGLAKISGTPGKTTLINHFLINESWYLVDLPGYGFAKTSKKNREAWEKMIFDYFANRENLVNTFILIDSRHKPLANDLELIEWFGESGLPFVLLFTKSDKPNQKELSRNLKVYRDTLLQSWEEPPLSIVTSSTTNKGKEEVLNLLDQFLESVQ
ncbi:MAG TPA: ribosome biogenesis GTP-binding protein YihA/YsxC [Bacteroidales bacterium]|nr:ribosome biogenesis GTP-binding protein YihA/YsxC [Bacteroidales bacterium]HRX98418.1 ribosome biogenesis GTP-binding protein YihA/YsxC [Bacteroidales bacterium]